MRRDEAEDGWALHVPYMSAVSPRWNILQFHLTVGRGSRLLQPFMNLEPVSRGRI
jgi:hypothetical protein